MMMEDMTEYSPTRPREKNLASAAETMISASLQAQITLIDPANAMVIPAIAESPIPVLARENRSPDRRQMQKAPRASRSKVA